MPDASSPSPSPTRRLGVLLALALLIPAGAADGATVLEHRILHEIRADGSVLETIELRVRMDEPADLEAWAAHIVPLDENRTLESLKARVILADGKKRRVRSRHQDTLEVSGPSELHSSASYRVVELPDLDLGAIVEIEHQVRTRPYFPAGQIALTPYDHPTLSLDVEVRGAPAGWRWRVDGETEGLTVEESTSGVRLRGLAVPAPAELSRAPTTGRRILRYGWGAAADWPAVARWYHDLSADSRKADEAVRSLAGRLTTGLDSPRERLDALASFVQGDVRYVAVEVGIGGYRPTPAAETLERRWGDCKDKSYLLLALLREIGIEAHPVLILASPRGRIDAEFATPFQFNHLIVAVPVDGLRIENGDPVGDGLLFLDPTQNRGASRWLHPADQDQDVLVVTGDGGRLARTPFLPAAESRRLAVDLRVDASGNGVGTLELELRGSDAAALTDALAGRSDTERETLLHGYLTRSLPGGRIERPTWEAGDDAHPRLTLRAGVQLVRWIDGAPGRRSFQLAAAAATPWIEDLEERRLPVVLDSLDQRVEWTVRLPEDWCPARISEPEVSNPIGSFRQEMAQDGAVLTLRRTSRIQQRWVEPEAFGDLAALSLADQRAQRRRIRLRCDAGTER